MSADSIGLDGCTWEKVLAEVLGDLPWVLGCVPSERQSQSSGDTEGLRPPWWGGEGSLGRPHGGRNLPSQPSHTQNKMCVTQVTRSQEWRVLCLVEIPGREGGLLPLSHQEPRLPWGHKRDS